MSGVAERAPGDPASALEERAGTAADAVDDVPAARVCRPGDIDALRDVVRRATAARHALVASGLGSHLAIGAPPAKLDLLLRLDRLSRIREHQAADMTVTVETGCTLAALDGVLAAAGQWLPLDPPAPQSTTVGGLIAANLSGPLRASQGTVRDLLLGLRWVSPAGDLVSAGGRVVKNVAGYDLSKVHVGALGTLGVLVEATFKVRPRPPCERALVLCCDDAGSAVDLALDARDAAEPAWLEIVSAGVLPGVDTPLAIAVGWLGLEEEVADAERRIRGLAASHRTACLTSVDGADARALRRRLAELALEPSAAILRAATLPDATATVLAEAGDGLRCAVHAVSGVARIAVREASSVVGVVGRLRPRLEAAGGTLVVERAGATVKHQLAALGGVFGDPGQGLALMRRLKDAFDPARTFAPGRFVAGI